MKIDFTRDQFKSLLKIVYLGNWLVNANRSDKEGDERIEEFDEIEEYIFSRAEDFKIENFVEYNDEYEQYFPTRMFEDLMQQYVDEYDDENFWHELFHRLSERDFFRAYPEAEVHAMSIEERLEKEGPFEETWDNEITEHGIDRLEVRGNDFSTDTAEGKKA